ncbi:hypothetical protein GGX14DRAFT_673391 [Mycena pura]|uniref:Secreted protein n=1 Tax=Mycena pura TaxID=153505 RepID=A0AAD6Y4H1_9AGAR|nr:hypothetical protein GGX14DRAFT_673391 [Mycena pura]
MHAAGFSSRQTLVLPLHVAACTSAARYVSGNAHSCVEAAKRPSLSDDDASFFKPPPPNATFSTCGARCCIAARRSCATDARSCATGARSCATGARSCATRRMYALEFFLLCCSRCMTSSTCDPRPSPGSEASVVCPSVRRRIQ